MRRLRLLGLLVLISTSPAPGQSDKPVDVPSTRWEMKKALDARKNASPRLPPPVLTEEEKGKGRTGSGQNGMRRLLDPEIRALWPRDWLDDNMPLTKAMRNELLWVTSRVNNCLY